MNRSRTPFVTLLLGLLLAAAPAFAQDNGRDTGAQPGAPTPDNGPGATEDTGSRSDVSTRDQVVGDDQIVLGSSCVGFDCVNGESFGFDTVRLKENNTRIRFFDTSNSASFPSTDWQLTANESSNGGLNMFAIEDLTSARRPFLIEASAPNNSFWLDDVGRIGFGTASPVVELHSVDGDSPTLRLEQNGASGWTPQTWDMAGNETNFFIRDVTNGSQLPFRIRPGADSDALYIDSDNDIGMGTNSPSGPLHVKRGSNDVMIVDANGNMTIGGILIEASNRELKTDFRPVNGESVLRKLDELPVLSWRFKTEAPGTRHYGPVAQDFYRIFGLGSSDEHVSPLDVNGVALAGVQALRDQNVSQSRRIAELEAENEQLEARLARLEALVSGLTAQPEAGNE
ncbi:MAG: tail fiber domain-containing protein [Bacteroidota bacterium]